VFRTAYENLKTPERQSLPPPPKQNPQGVSPWESLMMMMRSGQAQICISVDSRRKGWLKEFT